MKLSERVLIQMTKAIRLLEEEGYNRKTLSPMKEIVKEMRKKMKVQRVKTETTEEIIYINQT